MAKQLRDIPLAEVAKHNKEGDAWVVIDGEVFDVSKFSEFHPGGKHVLLQHSGQDATDLFRLYHNSSVLRRYRDKLIIGRLPESENSNQRMRLPNMFGEMIAYGDPIWYQRFNSPYFKETHRKWRQRVRDFTDKVILPTLEDWRPNPVPPKDIYEKMGQEGFLAVMCGQPWPASYMPESIKPPEDYDYFHEMILYDELARVGYFSVIAALTNGPSVAVAPILHFGSEEMKRKVLPEVFLGKKFIALAISEPQVGSNVAGMMTTAKREGDYYILNGNKKWITNGTYADYFVTAVRTGEAGQKGISFILVEKDTPGFSIRKVHIRDSDISGTAYLDFDQCRVPASNLIGEENTGFKLIMHNFNHERFYISCCCLRLSRVCLEESIKYALNRETFGKKLWQHQSVRMRIANMIRRVEAAQAWLESVIYQMCTMTHKEANVNCGDILSLMKAEVSKVYEICARETTQIFGGNALYVEGVGKRIEVAVGQVKAYQIPGGAEDVMDDFGARSAFKRTQTHANL